MRIACPNGRRCRFDAWRGVELTSSLARAGGAVRVASPKGRKAAPKEAEVAAASPTSLKPTSGFASARLMRR